MTVKSREELEALIGALDEYRKAGEACFSTLHSTARILLREYLAETARKGSENGND